jgi:segregation and condensation protein B
MADELETSARMQPDAVPAHSCQIISEQGHRNLSPGAIRQVRTACADHGLSESVNASAYAERTTAEAPPPLVRIIEALCFVEGRPVTAHRAAEVIAGLTEEQFHQAVAELQKRYREQGRPYAFVRQGEGYLLTIRPQYLYLIERLYGEKKEAVLSLAAIEVLAIIAYRQPVTRSTIEALRGRDSTAALRQLLRRGLIAVQPASESASAANTMTPVAGALPNSESGGEAANSQPLQATSSPNTSQAIAQSVADSGDGKQGDDPVLAGRRNQAAEKVGESPRNRREQCYVTTRRFLEVFGLRDLSDLPRTDDLQIL